MTCVWLSQVHVVDLGAALGAYAVTNNLNQALYVLSRDQMRFLEDRCVMC